MVSTTNAVVNVPVVTPDTTGLVTVTYTITNSNQPVDITLRATGAYEAISIRLQCGGVSSGLASEVDLALNGISTFGVLSGANSPISTVTEGDLAPGGIVSFGVTTGQDSVTVDHINAGTGLQSLTVVGTPKNATVNIPAFTPGTKAPVTVTFTSTDPNQEVDYTLRAASTFHATLIRVRRAAPAPSTQ